jgi:hypothetical protein
MQLWKCDHVGCGKEVYTRNNLTEVTVEGEKIYQLCETCISELRALLGGALETISAERLKAFKDFERAQT